MQNTRQNGLSDATVPLYTHPFDGLVVIYFDADGLKRGFQFWLGWPGGVDKLRNCVPLYFARNASLTGFDKRLGAAIGETLVVLCLGSPIDELLKLVRRVSADLLVVGANGSSEPHLEVGTLAVKCLRKAPTKVLPVSGTAAKTFRTITACVDFSPASRVVVEQARRVALSEGSEVHCLHVYHPPWKRLHYLTPSAPAAKPGIQKQYLAALNVRLEEFANSNPQSAVRCALFPHSRYGTGIMEYARQTSADLIVLGARGRTNLRYVMTGSTAERLLRELPCSVLAVRVAERKPTKNPLRSQRRSPAQKGASNMKPPSL